MSLVYRNLYIYRLMMNVLYKGKYQERFDALTGLLNSSDISVLEPCFGDTVIAEYCRATDRDWNGLDINPSFVAAAKKKGFNAHLLDISRVVGLPHASVCIMQGSLYHFVDELEHVLSIMCEACPKIIISEPVHNLSNCRGIIGKIARASANVGEEKHGFRFTKDTLTEMIISYSGKLNYSYQIIDDNGRDLIVVLENG